LHPLSHSSVLHNLYQYALGQGILQPDKVLVSTALLQTD
jgi:hypothetical protein